MGMNDGPYIWRAQAQRSLEADGTATGKIAREFVTVSVDGEMLVAFLATNEGYEPPQTMDYARGIGPGKPEQRQGEQAITRRMLAELVMRDTLRAWTIRESKAREQRDEHGKVTTVGNRALAEALVDAEPAPLMPRERQVRNMLRKVQEWAQGKYGRAGGRNGRRVAELRGDVDAAGARIAALSVVGLGVTGHWVISSDYDDRAVYTDPYDEATLRRARAVLARDGDSIVDLCVEEAQSFARGGEAMIERIYALHVEVGGE